MYAVYEGKQKFGKKKKKKSITDKSVDNRGTIRRNKQQNKNVTERKARWKKS